MPLLPDRSKNRIVLLDEWRGAAILLMVLYHAGYDLVAIFGVPMPFFFSPWMNAIRDCIAGSFLFLAGCSCYLSRSNLRRGLIVFGCGLLMSVATAVALPSQTIVFGVLHCLGACMLLYPLLRPLVEKLPPAWGLPLFFVLFLLCFRIPSWHSVGFLGWRAALPEALYQSPFLFWLGFPHPGFSSADYYPLLPWVLLFLSGSCFGRLLRRGPVPAFFTRQHCRFLAVTGRYTLYIYLLHQPILFGVFALFFWVL